MKAIEYLCDVEMADEFLKERTLRQMEGMPEPEVIYLPSDQWARLLCLDDWHEGKGYWHDQHKITEVVHLGVKLRKAPSS